MSNDREQSRRYRVDDLIIDAGTRELWRDGQRIDLPKLSFRLLLALVEAAPNLLDQEDLAARVWPGRVVTPETATQRVKLLRRALGDDAADPRYIGLVRGEGYRLIVPARQIGREPADAAPAARRPVLWASVAAAFVLLAGIGWWAGLREMPGAEPSASAQEPAVAIVPDSVAVLPFANASENPEDGYIVDGLSNRLRDQLGQVAGLRVVARASSVAVRDRRLSIPEIAARLGVQFVIEGTLVREGNDLSITVQLIDTASGFQVWSESYARSRAGLIEMQQQIAGDVVRRLLPALATRPSSLQPATHNVTANDYMLIARERELAVRENYRVDIPEMIEAIELYRAAIAADPDLVEAHSRLGGALLYINDPASAGKAIFKALSMAPENAEALYNQGLYLWAREQPGSGDAYRRAIEINPNHADAFAAYANWLWHQDRTNEAEQHYVEALSLDPLALNRHADLGLFYGHTGQRDEALDVVRRIESQFDSWKTDMVLARIYEVIGDLDVAIARALRAHRSEPELSDPAGMIAELYARIGDFDNADLYEPEPGIGQLYFRRRYDELIELGEELMLDLPGEIQIQYILARAYNSTGRYEQTIHLLERTRLRERVATDSRRGRGKEALATLADAYYGAGRVEDAREVAQWIADMTQQYAETGAERDWWPNTYLACALSTLQRDDEALAALQRIKDSPGLVWYPLLVDSLCFRRLDGDPRYESVVSAVEQRMRSLRERVPETLARFELELVAEN
ncbi:MAG: winged helix-turn-helix domain-containing protein [Woeseiaceae bacterium]|nr:winged helix-turn-helix domain-containing protein [Woeseiaceae bacterium]